jgi:hypothetical protein
MHNIIYKSNKTKMIYNLEWMKRVTDVDAP